MKIPVRQLILIFGAMLWCKLTLAQVYNYAPISHHDIETNPSRLASEQDINNRVQLIHFNNFSSSDRFSFSSLRVSKYFESSFTGVGLTFSNTSMTDDVSYNHVAICGGYRNILFNKVAIKAGAAYKITSANRPQENYDYYSFSSSEAGQDPESTKHNLNLSFSVSTGGDWFYASFSLLNLDLPWSETENSMRFPKYHCLNLSNIFNLIDRDARAWHASYSVFRKFYDVKEPYLLSHYMNLGRTLRLSREVGLEFGIRTGYLENEFLHFVPNLKFYTANFSFVLSYGFHRDKINFDPAYYSTSQINIIYIL